MGEKKSFNEALEEADLDKLIMRLRLYTHMRLARMFWRGESNGPIPGGWEPEDFVQAALRKGLSRVRVWRSSDHSLFDFLKGIISSDISNLALKSENVAESRVTTTPADANRNSVSAANLPGKRSEWPDASSSGDEELMEILQRVGEKDLDRKIVRCVLEKGLSASGEIAAELNLPVGEIYKAKKRLRRKFEYLRVSTRDQTSGSLSEEDDHAKGN